MYDVSTLYARCVHSLCTMCPLSMHDVSTLYARCVHSLCRLTALHTQLSVLTMGSKVIRREYLVHPSPPPHTHTRLPCIASSCSGEGKCGTIAVHVISTLLQSSYQVMSETHRHSQSNPKHSLMQHFQTIRAQLLVCILSSSMLHGKWLLYHSEC